MRKLLFRFHAAEKASGTLEMAEIPAPACSISTTPKLLMSTAAANASSPRKTFFLLFSYPQIYAFFLLWNPHRTRQSYARGRRGRYDYSPSKTDRKGRIYILSPCSSLHPRAPGDSLKIH